MNGYEFFSGIPNHLITANVAKYPEILSKYRSDLDGRSMIVKKLNMASAECIARGYLVGTGWAEYRKKGTVCGQKKFARAMRKQRSSTSLFLRHP